MNKKLQNFGFLEILIFIEISLSLTSLILASGVFGNFGNFFEQEYRRDPIQGHPIGSVKNQDKAQTYRTLFDLFQELKLEDLQTNALWHKDTNGNK